jgi:uncharacterized lipoprotein
LAGYSRNDLEPTMKRLFLATALLAALAACSWHPSNNGPARNTDDSPQGGYAYPVQPR